MYGVLNKASTFTYLCCFLWLFTVNIIVAVNKIDKPNADVERSKRMLLEHGIQVEEMGGEVQCIPISALKVLVYF